MITLEDNSLTFRFPEIHPNAACAVRLQRTLRIPMDSRESLGAPSTDDFPLFLLDDCAERLPLHGQDRGGLMVPVHQGEAMSLEFAAAGGQHGVKFPFAVKIAVGAINAVSGESWSSHLNRDPQDYIVIPEQPLLKARCTEAGACQQFVAPSLDEEDFDGAEALLRLSIFPMKSERYRALLERKRERVAALLQSSEPHPFAGRQPAMRVASGSKSGQPIWDDPHGLEAWDQRRGSSCCVTIVNSRQWMALTEQPPPTQPPSERDYEDAGLRWYDFYGGDARVIAAAEQAGQIEPIGALGEAGTDLGEAGPGNAEGFTVLRRRRCRLVRQAV